MAYFMSTELLAIRNIELEKARAALRSVLYMVYETEANAKANELYATFIKEFEQVIQ